MISRRAQRAGGRPADRRLRGVILDRLLLGHAEPNSPATESLIPYLRAALDAVAKAPEQASCSPSLKRGAGEV
jgi:hypothetical protein